LSSRAKRGIAIVPYTEALCGRLYPGGFGIQNGGVDRMSGMSGMLCIVLYRDVPSHHEPK